MKFNFENLNNQTRQLMIEEIKSDIDNGRLYFSKRFNDTGHQIYPQLLIDSVNKGDEQTLAAALKSNNCFASKEDRKTKNEITQVNVPENANHVLAESEFNRFYIRAIAMTAIQSGRSLQVYRARHSDKPRAESEMIIGKNVDASKLLSDLRNNVGVDTALGLPLGPNSGLTVKLT